jgi:hypothetical protein
MFGMTIIINQRIPTVGNMTTNLMIVSTVSSYLGIIFLAGYLITSVKARGAVSGSLQRFNLLTVRRISAYGVIGVSFLRVIVYTAVDGMFYTSAIINLFVALYFLHLERKYHKDDDDWFKGRGKKIKDGLKKRLTVKVPQPSLT